jgi:hypothetical protein
MNRNLKDKPKFRLRTDTTSGSVRIYPDDDATKAIVAIKGTKCLNMNDMQELVPVFDFSYHGDKHYGLDSLGIERE